MVHMDFLFEREFEELLEAIHQDVLIADGDGVVTNVSKSFEAMYGIACGEIVGRTVFDLEREGVFRPYVVARVLAGGEKITMTQKNQEGRDIVVSAVPVTGEDGVIRRVISFSRDITELVHLRQAYAQLEDKMARYEKELHSLRVVGQDGIIAADPATEKLFSALRRIAPFDSSVLLTGESGVGKSLYARAIHQMGRRSEGPFIVINCGAIPESLLEAELFGYERGAFTGASREGKQGLIEMADKGTLFLDEIAETPPSLQVKILTAIQEKRIQRIGGRQATDVDFRLITATNRDLGERMAQGLFREDLYYRLNVISIEIPPLRRRRADIVPLCFYFLNCINQKYGMRKSLSGELIDILKAHAWPGNIRELENLIERLAVVSETDAITPADLPDDFAEGAVGAPVSLTTADIAEGACTDVPLSLHEALARTEETMVKEAWESTHSVTETAKLLGVSQPTATRKIQKYV